MIWLILIALILICLIRHPGKCRHCSNKTYNKEYADLYDAVWYDEDRYRAEVNYISKNIGDKQITSILDLGCGTGNHIKFWNEMWPDSSITGMDLSLDQLSKARKKYPQLDIVHGSYLDATHLENNKFDMIACMYGAGNYTDDMSTLFQNVYKWLRPGGTFVFHGIDPRRLYDGCDQTASNTSLPMRTDRKGHCNVLYPDFVYSSWWSKDNSSHWARYNETFYKIRENAWPLDWDVSEKIDENVPLGITKYPNLTTNGHKLYLLIPSQVERIGRNIGFTKSVKNPVRGIREIRDQGSEEYFIFFQK
jgi:SAM-dependent methyltransferase